MFSLLQQPCASNVFQGLGPSWWGKDPAQCTHSTLHCKLCTLQIAHFALCTRLGHTHVHTWCAVHCLAYGTFRILPISDPFGAQVYIPTLYFRDGSEMLVQPRMCQCMGQNTVRG